MPGHVTERRRRPASPTRAATPTTAHRRRQVRRLRPAAAGAPPAASGTTRRSPSTSPPDELVDLEQARLVLRAEHGLAVDRGRLVREAVAEMLVDLEAHGEDSVVVPAARAP